MTINGTGLLLSVATLLRNHKKNKQMNEFLKTAVTRGGAKHKVFGIHKNATGNIVGYSGIVEVSTPEGMKNMPIVWDAYGRAIENNYALLDLVIQEEVAIQEDLVIQEEVEDVEQQ